MTLLELNSQELKQKIENELALNPALEVIDEYRCPTCHRRLVNNRICPECSRKDRLTVDEPIIFVSPYIDLNSRESYSIDELPAEEWTATPEDLPSFVLKQIAPELAYEDRPIAAHILTSLDKDGLLRSSVLEIARYHHVPISRVDGVIKLIQRAEPVGVGSETPQAALLIQLEVLQETHTIPEKAREAVLFGMDLMSKRAYNELGRLLNLSSSQAQRLASFISKNLNPYPARAHWGEQSNSNPAETVYITPDIIISRMDDNDDTILMVEILSPYAGMLRVNPMFREVYSSEVANQAPAEQSERWKQHLDQANLLVKCIQQRDHTIVRLMKHLAMLQRQYILQGDAYNQPITRAYLAEELQLHESTISRAVSGKAVQLPNKRIIPLAKMFDRSLHVRTALREIIEEELEPLSDTEIAERLLKQGYPVARRTVAKYRSMEGILPARLRDSNTRQNRKNRSAAYRNSSPQTV